MIYLDNAATTRVYPEMQTILEEYNSRYFFNPSAPYGSALAVSREIEKARATVAACINASPDEIYFTGGATEANNTVILGAHKNKKGCIVTTEGEHPSVYNAVLREKQRGSGVRILPLTASGTVNPAEFDLEDVSLVSVIHVSNETGAINDIEALARVVRARTPAALIHSDGVQAVGKCPVDVRKLGVDLYSFSGHKFHAPKGIGVLYVRRGVNINPLLVGGGQERSVRSGTENVAGILSLAAALKKKLAEYNPAYVRELKGVLTARLAGVEGVSVNSRDACVPYIVSVSARGVRGEVLLHALEGQGVLIGTGSACASRHSENRVLNKMGLSEDTVKSSIRVSFDEYTTKEEMRTAADKLAAEIDVLRGVTR